ncbi:MAG TPA: sulfurtransferase TusA family protein [Paenalcaligenes sp.]|nr:sulfurtransferase TusA family protein [Paenalcaligenes sp.]
MSIDQELQFQLDIDTSGLKCPLPILKAKKALANIDSGEVLKVITTDPHAEEDFQAFAAQAKHELLAQQHFDAEGVKSIAHYLKKR